MSTFRERYADLFGDTPEYDPINLEDRTQQRAIDIEEAAPSASPRAIELPTFDQRPAPQGAITGLLKAGTAMGGEALLGVGEYAARQASRNEFAGVRNVAGAAAEGVHDVRQDLAGYRQGLYDSMSAEVIDMKGREFLTLDPDSTIWQGNPFEVGEAIMYKFIEQVPMTAATLIPGGIMLRAGASAKALTYLGASEAGLSVGFIANEITDGINEMSDEELAAEAPVFAEMLKTNDPVTAREQFIAEAQGMAPLIGGALVGVVSAAAGRYLEPVLTGSGGGGALSRFGRGAVGEGIFQEGPQESIEQTVQNIAAQVYDADRSAFEGVGEAFAQGAAVGGPMGGAFGALAGNSSVPPSGDTVLPPAGPEASPQATESFEDVFGSQGGAIDASGQVDAFPDPQSIDITEQDETNTAAVSAAMRDSGVMEDMVDNLSQAQGDQQRFQETGEATPTQQGEMFPTGAPVASGPAVPVNPPIEQVAEPEQQVLPIPLRERGKPVLQENPRGARLPSDVVTRLTGEPEVDPKAVARRTDDMFDDGTEFKAPAFKPGGEQVADQIRKDTPFDERAELTGAVAGTQTKAEAAGKLVAAAGTQMEAERERAISGFFPPESYEFNSPEKEAEYRDTWSKLLDLEVQKELKGEIDLKDRGTAISKSNRDRAGLIKRLGQIRQVDKPKRTATKFVKAAVKADRTTVRTLRKEAAKTSQEAAPTEDFIGDLPELDRDAVDAMEGNDLDVAFEQAIRYKQESGANDAEVEGIRKLNKAPSLKRKQILRALTSRMNQRATDVRVKSTTVTKKAVSRKGSDTDTFTPTQSIKTEALTATSLTADESRADTIKRKKRSGDAHSELAANVKTGAKYLKELEKVDVVREDGKLTKDSSNFLRGREYLKGVLQLGVSMAEARTDDFISIDMAESYNKFLRGVSAMSAEKFGTEWSKLAKAQEQMLLQETGIAHSDPAKRQASFDKQNKAVLADVKRRDRMENVWAKDSVWQKFVAPVLNKYSDGILVGKPYKATREEMEGLAWSLKAWNQSPKKFREDFYTPLKKSLQYIGMTFDTQGNLIVEGDNDVQAFEEAEIEVDDSSAVDEAGIHVKAVAIVNRFRKVAENKKSTITALINAELAMLDALSNEGAIKHQGTAMATIKIPGLKDFTYRKAAEDLTNKRITKPVAAQRMSRMKRVKALKKYTDIAPVEATKPTASETDFDYEFYRETIDLPANEAAIQTAASAMGDQLEAPGATTAPQLLDAILQHLPQGHVYAVAAQKLKQLGMNDVLVAYDKGNNLRDGATGKFSPSDNVVIMSREKLITLSQQGDVELEARAIHVALHELTHAATHNAMRGDANLRNTIAALRGIASEEWAAQGRGALPYGLKGVGNAGTLIPLDEFVAEAYSNPEFQSFLKTVQLEGTTLWKQFVDLIKRLLNSTDAVPSTAFDAVMAVEANLFEGAGTATPRGKDLNMEDLDAPMSRVANNVWNKINQSTDIENRVRSSLRGQASHPIMTMEQMRDRYTEFFTDGELTNYVDAFFERNSRNAQLMESPEAMSREWTELSEADPDTALEFSRVATESTLYKIAADRPLSDPRNAAVKSVEQKARHKELSKRFNAMDKKWQTHYATVQSYYISSLKRESNLMLLNGLRGIITKGDGVSMDRAEFDSKYTQKSISQFNTRDSITAEFSEYLPEANRDAIIDTIVGMTSLSQLSEGNYFPLMRYGDYAVYAEAEGSVQNFADSGDANAYAAKQRAADPTATIQVYKNGDQFTVKEVIREFVLAENATAAEEAHARMVETHGVDSVKDVQKKFSIQSDTAISSNAALGSILDTLKGNTAAQAAMKAFYLRSLADTSFRKREINRKNRLGVDYDLQHRNFANYAKQSSYYTAQLEFGWKMGEAVAGMQNFVKNRVASQQPPKLGRMTTDQLSNVVNEIIKRDGMSSDPATVGKLTSGGIAMTQFYMLTSASYHMINATQPWMVSLPVMSGRHGAGDTFSAMKHAQGLIKQPLLKEAMESWGGLKALKSKAAAEKAFGVFEQLTDHIKRADPARADEYISMLTELRRRHILEVSPLTELREMSTGQTGKMSKVLDASRIMAHITEVNNRVLTSVAAYNLEYNKQLELGADTATAKDKALHYAGDMVSQTQFNYATANKPPLFQKYPLIFQFLQWPQHMYALLIRNYRGAVEAGIMNKSDARSALLGLLSTHAAVGGTIGMTLQPIKMALGLVALAFGDDDEPYTFQGAISGETFDRMIAQSTNDLFGTTASTAITKGIPAALGVDLSTRMSMGTLYFIDLKTENADSVLGSLAASFGGATLNQGMSFYDGFMAMGRGDYAKGFERLSPKFMRDIIRAGRYGADGLVNNAGDRVMDTSDIGFAGVAMQALGFTPTSITDFYSGQTAIKDVEGFVRDRKTELLRRYRKAETGAERRRVMSEITGFNRTYPQERITRSSILRNVAAQRDRESRYKRFGANIDESKATLYQGYGEPYR